MMPKKLRKENSRSPTARKVLLEEEMSKLIDFDKSRKERSSIAENNASFFIDEN